MCETFNGVLLEAGNKPVITLFENIRQYVTSRIAVKKGYVLKCEGAYRPNIVDIIEKEKNKTRK